MEDIFLIAGVVYSFRCDGGWTGDFCIEDVDLSNRLEFLEWNSCLIGESATFLYFLINVQV